MEPENHEGAENLLGGLIIAVLKMLAAMLIVGISIEFLLASFE